jgi:putative restriction endonuclease
VLTCARQSEYHVVVSAAVRQIIDQIENLNTYRRGERRAPHKPLLLLVALARLKQGQHEITFPEIEGALKPLLEAYAPPVAAKHQPELPYWHLQSDGLWRVTDAERLPRQAGGFPKMPALRETVGGFPEDVARSLLGQPGLIEEIAQLILDEHFPPSVHEDILAAVGLGAIEVPRQVRDSTVPTARLRPRDPTFRGRVLRAYEHRCAVTGFRAALGGSFFGCEAGHVMWHAYGGPDTVDNGISMEPTIHKLFDAGAWSLTDDRRILVSADYTGSEAAVVRLREHHGRPIRAPIGGESPVGLDYIRWHREPGLGGVFRGPAMSL